MIHDLAILLGTAGVVAALFQRLRLPVVLGYLVAGVGLGFLSRETAFLAHPVNVRHWGEFGVVLLMFSLGLEFSFRKLARVGLFSVATAVLEMGGMFTAGYLLARHALGWRLIESISLGALVSVSSTTIILKALDELGLKTRRFAEATFGVLVVEDIVAILMIVALTTIGGPQALSGTLILRSALQLGFIVTSWFLVGYFLLPPFLRWAGKRGSDEMLTVLSIGLCLGLVVLAEHLGYSAALGAFIMGSVLAESTESHRIEERVQPIRDVFSAVFFVYIGMMLDPGLLQAWWLQALGVVALVLFGKAFFVSIGALISGQGLRTSLQMGLSMAQIGEFSFVIATLAAGMSARSRMLYPLAVITCLVTSFTTPWLIRNSHRIADRVEELLPIRARDFLNRYASLRQEKRSTTAERREFYLGLAQWLACGILSTTVHVSIREWFPIQGSQAVLWLISTVLSAPLLWAMFRSFEPQGIRLGFGFLTVVWMGLNALEYFPFRIAAPAVLGLAVALAFTYGKTLGQSFQWLKTNFRAAFDPKQKKSGRRTDMLRTLAPWDAHLVRLKVHPNSKAAGARIQELELRSRHGLNVVVIRRGMRHLVAPGPQTVIFPKDELLVLGTDDQVEAARGFLENPPGRTDRFEEESDTGYELRSVAVSEEAPLSGKTLRECAIRERFGVMVVGMEHQGKRILNPETDQRIRPGDLLWIVGETQKLDELQDLLKFEASDQLM